MDVNENAAQAGEAIARTKAISQAEQAATLNIILFDAITDKRVQTVDIDGDGQIRRVEFFPDIRSALIEAAGQAPTPAEAATDVCLHSMQDMWVENGVLRCAECAAKTKTDAADQD